MSLNLERLEFDFNNPGDGPNIGSFLRSADGTLVTSTTAGAKEALDVNIAASDIDIQVDLDLTGSIVGDDEPDTEDPLKVGSRAHDQALVLGAVSADADKANQISDLYRRVWMTDAPSVGWSAAAATVGVTAVQLDASAQAGRQYVLIQNNGDKSIFIGSSNAVTTSSGIEIGKGSTAELKFGEALEIWAISGTAGQDVRVAQVG